MIRYGASHWSNKSFYHFELRNILKLLSDDGNQRSLLFIHGWRLYGKRYQSRFKSTLIKSIMDISSFNPYYSFHLFNEFYIWPCIMSSVLILKMILIKFILIQPWLMSLIADKVLSNTWYLFTIQLYTS